MIVLHIVSVTVEFKLCVCVCVCVCVCASTVEIMILPKRFRHTAFIRGFEFTDKPKWR